MSIDQGAVRWHVKYDGLTPQEATALLKRPDYLAILAQYGEFRTNYGVAQGSPLARGFLRDKVRT